MKNIFRTPSLILLCSVFAFTLFSCSTSIEDNGGSSSRGLAIKINTGSPNNSNTQRNLSRLAMYGGQDKYQIIVTVQGNGYQDEQSAFSEPDKPVSLVFKDVPIGIDVSATCQIKLGSIIVFKDTKSATVEPDGTVIELDLVNQLESEIVFKAGDNLSNLYPLIELCQTQPTYNGGVEVPTPPVIRFESDIGDLNQLISYLHPTKKCVINVANIGRTTFTENDLIANENGVQRVILPQNSIIKLQTNRDDSGNLVMALNNAIASAFALAGTDTTNIVELNYTNSNEVLLSQSMITTINNAVSPSGFGGKLKLTGNIEVDGNSSNYLEMILARVGNNTIKVRNNDLSDYANVIAKIENYNAVVSPFIIVMDTNENIPNYLNGATVTKIKKVELRGSATNVKIDSNAFKNWTNLSGTLKIPTYVTEIRDHAFNNVDDYLFFSFEDTDSQWTALGDDDVHIGFSLNPSDIYPWQIDDYSIKKLP